MHPDRDTFEQLYPARDIRMEEGGVTEGGKNTASFLFREWTQQHKHEASS